ncbi:hypothetical protein JCM11641_005572 [Rhodosporidiobolus odoratus]
MALTQAKLPAPLRLSPSTTTSLSNSQAHSALASFLASDSSALLAGSGVVRASLQRLAQALKDEGDLLPSVQVTSTSSSLANPTDDGEKSKKRRKSESGDGKKQKKRKVEA